MSDLRTILTQSGLGEYAERMVSDRIDLAQLAEMSEQDLREYAAAWPWGDQKRLRDLCTRLQAQARSGATAQTPPQEPAASAPPAAPAAHQVDVPPLPADATIDPELLHGLPLVIARPLEALLGAKDPHRMVHASDHLVDVTLRFLCLICQVDYLGHPNWQDQQVNDQIDAHLERPSLGDWSDLITMLLKSAKAQSVEPFLQELPEAWREIKNQPSVPVDGEIFDRLGHPQPSSNRISIVDALTSARNGFAHRRKVPGDPVEAGSHRDNACRLIRGLAWLASYDLFLAESGSSTLLRGLRGVVSVDGPRTAAGGSSLVLRRASARTRSGTESRELPLPPLIVSERALRSDGRAGEPALYNGLNPRKGTIWFTPASPDERAIESTRLNEAYSALRERKRYVSLGRDALTQEILRDRVAQATRRSLDQLRTSGKYREEFHCIRESCEPMLEGWAASPKALLGIEARAGAGKTGVMASLAGSWSRDGSCPPVLFTLAREFQSSSLDQVVRRLLVLDEDVFLDDIWQPLGGLLVLVDGLNECPSDHRDAILQGIIAAADRRQREGRGPRFAVSWREDDRAWIERTLRRRELWWTPLELRHEARSADLTPTAGDPEGSTRSDARQSLAPRPQQAESGIGTPGKSAARATDPCFRLRPLTDDELTTLWDRYKTQGESPTSRHRCAPRFDFETLRQKSPALAEELRNPLTLRIAMELYHDQPLPPEVSPEHLFSGYLERLRAERLPAGALLDLMAELMVQGRSTTVSQWAIEDRHRELVHASPVSALDLLRDTGVLSCRHERNQPLLFFTNERVGEQVIGEWLVSAQDAVDATWLAGRCTEMEPLPLARGAIRAALSILIERHGFEYLTRFIDANPPGVASIAGRLLEDRLRRSDEGEARALGEALIAEQTDSDFDVAREAVLGGNTTELDDEQAVPFLEALRNAMLSASSRSAAARDLCLHYDNRLGEEASLDWLHLLEQAWRKTTHHERRALVLGRIAKLQSRNGRHAEAVEAAKSGVAVARASKDRNRIALCLRILGDVLVASGEREAAILVLRESLDTASRPKPAADWGPYQTELVCSSLAKALHHLGRQAECLASLSLSLEAWRSSDEEAGSMALAAARLADVHGDVDDVEGAVRLAHFSVEHAAQAGDRRLHALALEWLGDTMRRADRHAAAIPVYEQALKRGLEPVRAPEWFPSSVLRELARCHRALRCHDQALRCERSCLEALLADDDLTGASTTASRISDLLHDLGDSDGAAASAHRSVELAVQSGERRQIALSQEWLGCSLRKLSRPEEAMEALAMALETGLTPERLPRWSPSSIHVSISSCLQDLGRLGEAVDAEELCLAAEIEDETLDDAARTAARLAEIEQKRGHAESAVAWSMRAIEFASDAGEHGLLGRCHKWFADILWDLGRRDEALDASRRAAKVASHSGDAEAARDCHEALGLRYSSMQRHREAVECFRRALAEDPPGSTGTRAWLGDSLNQLGQSAEALRAVAGALQDKSIDPDDYELVSLVGIEALRQLDATAQLGRWAECLRVGTAFTADESLPLRTRLVPLRLMEDCRLEAGVSQASEFMKDCLSLIEAGERSNPNDETTRWERLELANQLAKSSMTAEARKVLAPISSFVGSLTEAVRGPSPYQSQPWEALGRVALREGQWRSAVRHLRLACEPWSGDDEFHDDLHALTLALWKSGDRKGARAAIQRLLDGITQERSAPQAVMECVRMACTLPADAADLAHEAAVLAVRHVQKVIQPSATPFEGDAWLTAVLARCGPLLVRGASPESARKVQDTLLKGLKALERARREGPSEFLQRCSLRVACDQGWQWIAQLLDAQGKATEAAQARRLAKAWHIDVGALLDACLPARDARAT